MKITDAKVFLYNLSKIRQRLGEYYIMGADHEKETEDIIQFFSPEFIEKKPSEPFDVYYIKENVPKPNRISGSITPNSILNIQKKIENEFSEYSVHFSLVNQNHQVMIYDDETKYKFELNEKLELESALIESAVTQSMLEPYEKIKTRLNSLLTKQRYYYRRKK